MDEVQQYNFRVMQQQWSRWTGVGVTSEVEVGMRQGYETIEADASSLISDTKI